MARYHPRRGDKDDTTRHLHYAHQPSSDGGEACASATLEQVGDEVYSDRRDRKRTQDEGGGQEPERARANSRFESGRRLGQARWGIAGHDRRRRRSAAPGRGAKEDAVQGHCRRREDDRQRDQRTAPALFVDQPVRQRREDEARESADQEVMVQGERGVRARWC